MAKNSFLLCWQHDLRVADRVDIAQHRRQWRQLCGSQEIRIISVVTLRGVIYGTVEALPDGVGLVVIIGADHGAKIIGRNSGGGIGRIWNRRSGVPILNVTQKVVHTTIGSFSSICSPSGLLEGDALAGHKSETVGGGDGVPAGPVVRRDERVHIIPVI